MDVKFDLQQYLETMESRAQERHTALVEKVDTVVTKVNDHETRIVLVENTRRTVKWLGATVIGALIVAGLDLLFSHLPKLLAQP